MKDAGHPYCGSVDERNSRVRIAMPFAVRLSWDVIGPPLAPVLGNQRHDIQRGEAEGGGV